MVAYKDSTISLAHKLQPAIDMNPDVLLSWLRLTTARYEEYLLSSVGVRYPRVEVASVQYAGKLGGPLTNDVGFQRPALSYSKSDNLTRVKVQNFLQRKPLKVMIFRYSMAFLLTISLQARNIISRILTIIYQHYFKVNYDIIEIQRCCHG